MQILLGMILGAVLLIAGVYAYDFAIDFDGRKRSGRIRHPDHRQLGRRLRRLARDEGTCP